MSDIPDEWVERGKAAVTELWHKAGDGEAASDEAIVRAVIEAVLPLGVLGLVREERRRTWQECVEWFALHGQGDVKGRLLDEAEEANPYRREGEHHA